MPRYRFEHRLSAQRRRSPAPAAARERRSGVGCSAMLCRTLLRQWVETVQWLVPAGLLPLRPKLVLMQRCPFGYESHGPCWQLARDDTQAVNGDPGFRVCVLSVKMRA